MLADGAGGHRRGAEAAQRAVARIEAMLRDDAMAFSPANLTQIVRLAHSELQHHQDSDFADARMHCTIVVLWIDLTPDTRCGRMSETRACTAYGTDRTTSSPLTTAWCSAWCRRA